MIEEIDQSLEQQSLLQYGLPNPKRFEKHLANRDYLRETSCDTTSLI